MARDSIDPQGIFYARGRRAALNGMVEWADVIHCHDDAYPTDLWREWRKKKLIYMAHIGDIPRRLFRTNRMTYYPHVKHCCITNGYGRLFDAEARRAGVPWHRLPDILDLDHPFYKPEYDLRPRIEKQLEVIFTYSNDREPGSKINAKAPRGTKKSLGDPIEGINWRLVTGLRFEMSMLVKKRAHIVLDEIFSPYTHLSALEGAAVGACVLTNYDDYTVRELCDFVGAPHSSYPFMKVNPENVRRTLEKLRAKPLEVIERGRAARAWMEKYYNQKALLAKYMELYLS